MKMHNILMVIFAVFVVLTLFILHKKTERVIIIGELPSTQGDKTPQAVKRK